ncbi:hypothetical protein BH11VER1_BH11VER1_35270 [soil metagenome]
MRFLTTILLFMTGTSYACTIPVFRYALDRWEADRFHLVLPPSAAKDTALAELLRPLRANGKANLDIETSKDVALSQSELRFSTKDQSTLWSGALDATMLQSVLDSPARKNILQHILAGDSIVWVMADHGTPEDEAQAQRIEKRLKFLEQVASLPIQNPNDPDSQLGPGPPLKLKFTLLRFRCDDPAESVFVKMLAGPKIPIDPAQTSFAAAIFGRGRVLGAWALEDLTDAALEDASMFLVGRCSCRMKNDNPGWDILMEVDWGKALQAVTDKEASSLPPVITADPMPLPSANNQTSSANPVVEVTAKPNEVITRNFETPKPMTLAPETASVSIRTKVAIAGGITVAIGLAWLALSATRSKPHG